MQDSDIPAPSSGKTHGGVVEDTLGIGGKKRKRAPAKRVMGSDNPSQLLGTRGGSDAMDASETVTGKRGRAPVGGAMDSNMPTIGGKECRVGDLHLASFTWMWRKSMPNGGIPI